LAVLAVGGDNPVDNIANLPQHP